METASYRKAAMDCTAADLQVPALADNQHVCTFLTAFKRHDVQKTGLISEHNLCSILLAIGIAEEDMNAIMLSEGVHKDGMVDYECFLQRLENHVRKHQVQKTKAKLDTHIDAKKKFSGVGGVVLHDECLEVDCVQGEITRMAVQVEEHNGFEKRGSTLVNIVSATAAPASHKRMSLGVAACLPDAFQRMSLGAVACSPDVSAAESLELLLTSKGDDDGFESSGSEEWDGGCGQPDDLDVAAAAGRHHDDNLAVAHASAPLEPSALKKLLVALQNASKAELNDEQTRLLHDVAEATATLTKSDHTTALSAQPQRPRGASLDPLARRDQDHDSNSPFDEDTFLARRELRHAATVQVPSYNLGKAADYFKQFLEARTVKDIFEGFTALLHCAVLAASDGKSEGLLVGYPYVAMRSVAGLPWKAPKVWELLDAQTKKEDYAKSPLQGKRILVVGAGPIGLRFALEASLSGAKVTVLEKRESFTRINRLHLWDWVKQDLIGWGAKIFSPPGGTFGVDNDYVHIGIGELQFLLLKCCLLLGVTVEMGVQFKSVSWQDMQWRAHTDPPVVGKKIFLDALVCCDGAASQCAQDHGIKAIAGGLGKEGQAIGMVANFVNSRTRQERALRQFSWARQFNGPMFNALKDTLGVDLQNIVYYRGDDSHYLIMTPTKQCLVDAGCLKSADPGEVPLLHASNVDVMELQKLARNVANYYGLPNTFTPSQSVMAFDFSDTRRHDQAVTFKEASGATPLPVCLAGDALLEPFWPTGLGCIRGFLGAFDCLSHLAIWFATADRDLVIRRAQMSYDLLKSLDGQTRDMTLKPDREWRLDPATRYKGFRETS